MQNSPKQVKLNLSFIDIGIIFILGLTPLLWFDPGFLIKGIDFDLPLTFERFTTNFFYLWDYQNGAGLPRNLHLPALMFFLPQALLQGLGVSLEIVQKVFFCQWFVLPGFAFYFLMRVLMPDKGRGTAAARMIAVSFYMFNLYLEPIWIGFNMANLSAYVAVPIALGILIRAIENRRPTLITGAKIGLVFFAFPALAQNPSMTLICFIPFLFLFFRSLYLRRWKKESLLYLLKIVAFSLLFISLMNSYWILPEIKKLFDSNIVLTSSNVTGGNVREDVYFATDWLKGLSRHTNLVNVIKMQGDWAWYAGYRQYAQIYWSHPFLIVVAWFPFLISLLALWKSRNQFKWFFGILLFLSLLFSTGANGWFGYFYLWLVKNVPLVWTIRSPWYKFTLLTCLAYGVLIGFGAKFILEQILTRWRLFGKIAFPFTFFLFISLSPLYSFPLVSGKHFKKQAASEGYPNHFKIPKHVLDAAEWLNKEVKNNRVMDLPSRGISYNNWGYEGFMPLIGYFLHVPLYSDNHPIHIPYQGAWGSSWIYLSKLYRNAMERGLTPYISNILRLLRVNYVIHEGDFRYNVLPFPVTRKQINTKLKSLKGVSLKRQFSQVWDLWEVSSPLPESYFVHQLSITNGTTDVMVPLSVRLEDKLPGLIQAADIEPKTLDQLIKKGFVDEVINVEGSLLDLTIDSLDARYLHRFNVKPTDELFVTINKRIPVNLGEEYLVLAKKEIPVRDGALRIGIDFAPYPQNMYVQWNHQYPVKSISELKREDFIPNNPLISFNQIRINNKMNFSLDDEVSEPFDVYSSDKWQYLGNLKLDKEEEALLQIKGYCNRLTEWNFYLVPKVHFIKKYEQIKSLYKDPSVDQTYVYPTTSTWKYNNPQENNSFVTIPRSDFELTQHGENETFQYIMYGKTYTYSKRKNLSFNVDNKYSEEVVLGISFVLTSFHKRPPTIKVQLNGEIISDMVTNPLQENVIVLKNIKLKPGKNQITIKADTFSVRMEKIFGDGVPQSAVFAIWDIHIGEIFFVKKFHLPSSRNFKFKLYPYLGLKQNGEAWKQIKSPKGIVLDGKEYPLSEVKKGEKGEYYEIKEPLFLEKGNHQIRIPRVEGQEYILTFETSRSKDAQLERVSDFKRKSPTRLDLNLRKGSPGVIIFLESYDPKWKALSNGKKELNPHFKVNSYANAFIIEETDEQNIRIVYAPQKYLISGLVASGLSFILIGLACFVVRRRDKGSQ